MGYNILFIGDLNKGTRSLMRAKKLKRISESIACISNTKVPFSAGIDDVSIYKRIRHRMKMPVDETNVNQSIVKYAKKGKKTDIVWVEKSIMLKPYALRLLKKLMPGVVLVSVSEDDMYAKHNRSLYYDQCIKYYDLVFTTKTYNLEEMKLLGANDTELFLDSFDEMLHKPMDEYSIVSNKIYDVVFVGTYEEDRANTIIWLGQQNIRCTVYGNGWSRLKGKHVNVEIMDKPVYGNEYVSIINKSKINLGFLRKINRDTVTSRTMEIIGCGGFLMAERTNRHVNLFREGCEAEFFSDKFELENKIRYYLLHPDRIKEVSRKGRERGILCGYDMSTQISKMVNSSRSFLKT